MSYGFGALGGRSHFIANSMGYPDHLRNKVHFDPKSVFEGGRFEIIPKPAPARANLPGSSLALSGRPTDGG